MFALLPVFAGLLKVAYFGRSRPYPSRPRRYDEHLVFAAQPCVPFRPGVARDTPLRRMGRGCTYGVDVRLPRAVDERRVRGTVARHRRARDGSGVRLPHPVRVRDDRPRRGGGSAALTSANRTMLMSHFASDSDMPEREAAAWRRSRRSHLPSYLLMRSFAACSSSLPSSPFAATSFIQSSGTFAVAFCHLSSSDAGMV